MILWGIFFSKKILTGLVIFLENEKNVKIRNITNKTTEMRTTFGGKTDLPIRITPTKLNKNNTSNPFKRVIKVAAQGTDLSEQPDSRLALIKSWAALVGKTIE